MSANAQPPEPDDATDIEADCTPRPWERQPGESTPAWAAFQQYRDLGLRRTLDAVNQEPDPSTAPGERRVRAKRRRNGSVSCWSRRHSWVSRAASYDAEVDRQTQLAHVEAVREMGARHAQAARELQALALRSLATLSPDDMAAADILRFMIEAAKLERLALGEPTERTSQRFNDGKPIVMEIVERIVPVRGDDRPVPPPSVRVVTGVTLVPDDGAGGGPDDSAAFDLPDEPPAFLRRP